jgi:hypothetical protein
LNIRKTKVILLGQQSDLNRLNVGTLPPICLENTTLEYSQFVKNLGVYFDPTLSWDIHIRNISKIIMGNIYSLDTEILYQMSLSLS